MTCFITSYKCVYISCILQFTRSTQKYLVIIAQSWQKGSGPTNNYTCICIDLVGQHFLVSFVCQNSYAQELKYFIQTKSSADLQEKKDMS